MEKKESSGIVQKRKAGIVQEDAPNGRRRTFKMQELTDNQIQEVFDGINWKKEIDKLNI